jgi:hypothetical protein
MLWLDWGVRTSKSRDGKFYSRWEEFLRDDVTVKKQKDKNNEIAKTTRDKNPVRSHWILQPLDFVEGEKKSCEIQLFEAYPFEAYASS